MIIPLSAVARAATYSTPINGFAVDSSGEFVAGTFDFGLTFTKIESVVVEVRTPGELPGGFCTGSYCSLTSLGTKLHNLGEHPLFPDDFFSFAGPNHTLFGSFFNNVPNGASQAYISPLNPYNGLGTPPFPPEWPSFLLDGRGTVSVQQFTQWGCYLNCNSYGTSATAPTSISSGRLIVEGAAVPEPTSNRFLVVLALLGYCYVLNRHRRMGIC